MCDEEVAALVVDNGSADGSVEMVQLEYTGRRDLHVRLIANESNRGFGGANNQGFAAARGRFIAILNNDAEAEKNRDRNRQWLARIADAVIAAGGALAGADIVGLNMARKVADGEQILVGITAPLGAPTVMRSSAGATSGPQEKGPPGDGKGAGTPGPVDLNTATEEQLDDLPGIGPVMAKAIVAWRGANGRFASVDQLGEVDGIGPSRLEKLRALVKV